MDMPECFRCSRCCHNVSIEVDEPETDSEIDEYIWMLLHKNIRVYINDEKWYVEFITPCRMIGSGGECTIYEKRPDLCREYDPENCLRNGELEFYDVLFEDAKSLKRYWMENYE